MKNDAIAMDVQNTEANDEPKSVKIEFDRLLLIAEQEGLVI